MPRQSGPKPNFTCKLLILNRMKALSRFAEPFQNLSTATSIWTCSETATRRRGPYGSSSAPNPTREKIRRLWPGHYSQIDFPSGRESGVRLVEVAARHVPNVEQNYTPERDRSV